MPTLTAIKVPDGLSDPYRMNVYVSKRYIVYKIHPSCAMYNLLMTRQYNTMTK